MRRTLSYSLAFVMACLSSCQRQTKRNIPFTQFIPVDSANKMLNSYLNSISYQANDSTLRSISFDMAQLRAYTDSPATGSDRITSIKVMFAHKLSYINSGKGNTDGHNNRDAVTFIIAAYTEDGTVRYLDGDKIMNTGAPCPTNCPPGDAGEPLLPNPEDRE